jgi:hypothetical protein
MPPLFALENQASFGVGMTACIKRWTFPPAVSLFAFKALIHFMFYSKLISVSKPCQFFIGFGKNG